MNSDEETLEFLGKAIVKAKESIERDLTFRPFLMTIDSEGVMKVVENHALSDADSYSLLEDSLTQRVKESSIDMLIIATRDIMPQRFSQENGRDCIRLHLEERSQLSQKISARFLYIPYLVYRVEDSDSYYVKLGNPEPVGFPALYLT
ncbi:hypothetical protein MNB_SV-6-259 [hydrothermal vent metagenome]|uniref:Uncharacterized protein n=1 Tax=hydrothermal vent metagenome TaxID=652676 RepID=A0A1W1CE27_9ZZZZ